MLLIVITLLGLRFVKPDPVTPLCSIPINCTTVECPQGNSTCNPCKNSTCADARADTSPCQDGNISCVPPVDATSRLLPGVDTSSNASNENSITASTKFTPSLFLGAIPEHAVGEVFSESVGPRQRTPFSLPPKSGNSRQYAIPPEEQYTHPAVGSPFQHRPSSVEIQIDHHGDHGIPSGEISSHVVFGKPDIEIRPVHGFGQTEIEIRQNAALGHHEIEIRPQMSFDDEMRPLGGYSKPTLEQGNTHSVYGKPDLSHQLEHEKQQENSAGKAHRDYGKPYDPGNAIDYTGYPETKPIHPFYEAFENMKNLMKPSKGSGPYFFEDNFQDHKPVSEEHNEDTYKHAFPPANPIVASSPSSVHPPEVHHHAYAPQYHHSHHPEHYKGGTSKWKGVLRLLTTVLPLGLLIAALSPNVLVINPTEKPMVKTQPGNQHQRSLEAPLGPCGLRKLCEALSESPADFDQFLKAAKQGSTPELKEIIRKAESKECSSIECGQLQELRPTQSTVR